MATCVSTRRKWQYGFELKHLRGVEAQSMPLLFSQHWRVFLHLDSCKWALFKVLGVAVLIHVTMLTKMMVCDFSPPTINDRLKETSFKSLKWKKKLCWRWNLLLFLQYRCHNFVSSSSLGHLQLPSYYKFWQSSSSSETLCYDLNVSV